MRRWLAGSLLFLVCAAHAQAEDVKPSWPIPEGHKWVAVNGYPMTYREFGQGTPMVLVHGSTSDSRAFTAQLEPLSKVHRVIAVHLRHFFPEKWNGESGNFSIDQHAADVAALIKKLDLGKVHLLGHSRGGGVVVEVAKKNPEVIRTLILPDATIDMPVPETEATKKSAEFRKQLISSLQENLKAGNIERGAEAFVEALNGPGAWAKAPEALKKMLFENIFTALGDKGRPTTTCDEVKKFDFPVLLLTGEKSPKSFEFYYSEMRKCRDFPATIIVPNAAHAMQRMNPEFFNKTVLEFAAKH